MMLHLMTFFFVIGLSESFSTLPSRTSFALPSTTPLEVSISLRSSPTKTRLYAEEAPGDAPEAGDEASSKQQTDASSTTDILNSPAFLKRKIDVLKSDIAAVEEKISEANTMYEANKAEWGPQLESLRKEYATMQERLNKDATSGKEVATVQVVKKILGVLDTFDRAFNVIEASTDAEKEIEASYKAAYDMIIQTFDKLGVKKIETVGKEFDYNLHQAIMTRVSDDFEEGIVCEELARGYATEDGNCLRPAMVVVAA